MTRADVDLAWSAAERASQLASLAATAGPHREVRVRYRPPVPAWVTGALALAAAFGVPTPCQPDLHDDESEAFHACARALAGTGAAWHWTRA